MATGDKLVNLEVLKETVQKEVVDLKSAINAFPKNVGVSLSSISKQKTIDDATIVSVSSNGESIQVTTDSETVITHLGKNLYPYSDIPRYTYAWSQITTKAGMQNPVFLKGGHSYIISIDKNADEAKYQFLVKAAKPDGTWVDTVSDINFHNWTKTSGTSYNDTIKAFSSNAGFNNEGIAFITPAFDVYIDITVNSTSNNAVGNHPMIEVSSGDLASTYEKYSLLETITVNGSALLIPLCGANTIYSASGTFDVAYYQVANLVDNIEDLQYKTGRIVNGDYTNELKGTSPVLLNVSIGSTVDLSPLNTAGTAHYTLLIDDVLPGEYFQIFAVDGNTARPWAFLDGENKLLSVAYNAYARNVALTAPQNAKKLLVQVGSGYLSNAYVIRANSLSFLSTGSSIDINALNNQYDVTEKLENATSIIKGDSPTVIKSRANLFSLIHFSDVHGNADNIQRILDFNNKYSKYIMDIIHTGDAPSTYFGDNNPFAFVGGEQIMEVVGNHECWIQGETWPRPYTATAAQVYEKFFAPFISSWNVTSPGTNLCYYYKDYATAKVRLIVLDCIHYDATQEAWFETALAGAKTNSYRVVTVTHYPAMTGLTNIDCTFGTYGESISAQTPPTGTDQVERMPESAFNVVDTFITGGGEFVCWLSGHTHGDFIGTVTGHTNQIQIIITTANTTNGHGDAARVSGTKTQDAFNIFVVDGTNKLIKLIRIGATRDRYMRKRETLCINYSTKNVVSNA